MLVQDERRLGRNQDLRPEPLNADLKAFQSGEQCRHPMPPIFKQDLFKDEWAVLNSRLVKAANSRALVPWLCSLVSRFFDSGSGLHKSAVKVVKCLVDMDALLYSAGFVPTIPERQQFSALCLRFGRH